MLAPVVGAVDETHATHGLVGGMYFRSSTSAARRKGVTASTMSDDAVSEIRTTADGEATEIPPTTSVPPSTEPEPSQPKPAPPSQQGSPSKRASKLVGSPYKQLSRRFTSKRVDRVRQVNHARVRGDSFTLFTLHWVPHAAVLAIIISMVAMAFMQAPTSNPREERDAWARRPIQWGETQNMWMPFYSFFAMLMTLLFSHSFVRIAVVAEVHYANFEEARARENKAAENNGASQEAGAPAAAAKPLLRQETKWLNKAITKDKLPATKSQVAPLGVPPGETNRRACGWCGWQRGGMRRGEWWRWWARGAMPQLQSAQGGEVTMIGAAKTFAPSEVVLWVGFLLACE